MLEGSCFGPRQLADFARPSLVGVDIFKFGAHFVIEHMGVNDTVSGNGVRGSCLSPGTGGRNVSVRSRGEPQ
jgi:hypothetical protein